MTAKIFCITMLLLHGAISYGQREDAKNSKSMWLTSKEISLSTFLQRISIQENPDAGLNILVMTNDFLDDWVKSSDIDTLISLATSRKRCNCFVSPLSSTIPYKDSADLGGYAIEFIKAYKEGRKVNFGLYACPKTNSKDVEELSLWWTRQKALKKDQ